MACTARYAKLICDKLAGMGDIAHRKMLFGDRMVYCNDIPVLYLCRNKTLVKPIPQLEELMKGQKREAPYEGAADYYVMDTRDAEALQNVVRVVLGASKERPRGRLVV